MKQVSLLILLCWCLGLSAQNHSEIANLKTGNFENESSVLGLWTVTRVMVGDRELTPTAKWFEFKSDGTQVSGNGWVQNFSGHWKFDVAAGQLQSTDLQGNTDGYGPFRVSFASSKMTWERQEDGMTVTVSLRPISEKPLAPWDKIVGNWTLEKVEEVQDGKTEVLETESTYSYYFGWHRRYRKFDASGNRVETGIWHIESHSPWLWLISDNDDSKTGQSISFDKNTLTFTIDKGQGKQRFYFRKE